MQLREEAWLNALPSAREFSAKMRRSLPPELLRKSIPSLGDRIKNSFRRLVAKLTRIPILNNLCRILIKTLYQPVLKVWGIEHR